MDDLIPKRVEKWREIKTEKKKFFQAKKSIRRPNLLINFLRPETIDAKRKKEEEKRKEKYEEDLAEADCASMVAQQNV